MFKSLAHAIFVVCLEFRDLSQSVRWVRKRTGFFCGLIVGLLGVVGLRRSVLVVRAVLRLGRNSLAEVQLP